MSLHRVREEQGASLVSKFCAGKFQPMVLDPYDRTMGNPAARSRSLLEQYQPNSSGIGTQTFNYRSKRFDVSCWSLAVTIQLVYVRACKHKATKAPRKPATKRSLDAGFLGAFVALCLHASVLNVLNNYQPAIYPEVIPEQHQ